MKVDARSAIAYILSKLGCQHPFTFSRILLLAELEALEKTGERLTSLRYVGGPGTFYIEGLKEMIESDPCFKRREGDPSRGIRGCIEYKCEPPQLPSDVRELIDNVIERVKGLSDEQLNKLVLNHPLYRRVVEAGV